MFFQVRYNSVDLLNDDKITTIEECLDYLTKYSSKAADIEAYAD